LLKQIPIKTYNQEEFLKNHRDLEYQDSAYIYLVRFKDFKIKESISPLSFEKERIRNIILNKRKIDLIKKMREDILNELKRKMILKFIKMKKFLKVILFVFLITLLSMPVKSQTDSLQGRRITLFKIRYQASQD